MPILVAVMDYGSLPIFSAMKSKLNYLSGKQSVLAQNVANADTPDYRAKDIEAPDFGRMVSAASGQLPVTTTSSKHIAPKNATGAYQMTDRKSTYEQSPMGNNVSVEEEMMRVAQTQAEYQQVINMYRKTVSMFKTALGSNSNG